MNARSISLVAAGVALGSLLAAGPAGAVSQTVSFSGTLMDTTGTADGAAVSISATYDDISLMNLGLESINLSQGTGSSFLLEIAGLPSFDQTDDISHPNGPFIRFDDGAFDGFNFVSNDFDFGGMPAFVTVFDDVRILDQSQVTQARASW